MNAQQIREYLMAQGLNFTASSDSEVISSLIAYHIVKKKDILSGILQSVGLLEGSFSLIIASSDDQLIAVRDPSGYRPLCLGRNDSGFAVASESCALDTCGFAFIRDINPGEIVVVDDDGVHSLPMQTDRNRNRNGLCIFEYVYFARPDSVIDKQSVYEARYRLGAILAEEHPVEADVVCGVPDSGIEAASGFSEISKIPLVSGFVKEPLYRQELYLSNPDTT